MRWQKITLTLLAVAALVAISIAPAMASTLVYFGATTGGSTGATLWRYDATTNTTTSVEGVLEQVDSIAVDDTHAYTGIRVPGQGIIKRYAHAGGSQDIQLGLSTVESLAVSDSRLYAALSADGGGLVKHYPKTAPFIHGGIDGDIELNLGAGKELLISSDGNTLYTSLPNAGGGGIKQYNVTNPFSPAGSDFQFNQGSSNMHLDETAGRLVAGFDGNGGVTKSYPLPSGAVTDNEFGVGNAFAPAVTSGQTSNGSKVFTLFSAGNGIIKQYDMLAPAGGPPGDMANNLCGNNPGGCAAAVGDGHIQYANGKLYALFNDGPTGAGGVLKSWDVDGPIPDGAGLNPADVSPGGQGDPLMLELAGDLLFMGTSGSNGSLRVYDTATEQFIHESFGYGDFTAFGSSVLAGGILGDYNGNDVVDAADYTVWLDNLGASITLPGENPAATTPGLVDQEDYDFWKSNFASGAGTSTLAAVPEPSSISLIGLAAVPLLTRRRRKH